MTDRRLMLPILLLISISYKTANGDVVPVCVANSGHYYGPKLPTMPTAFQAVVQANILNRNYSILMSEYYDLSSNRGAARFQGNGRNLYMIYNYNYNEMIAIDESTRNCSVRAIGALHGGRAIFGKNSSKIGSIAELFHFGAQFNETFKGNTTVRGIKCFHWQTCINHQNSSFVLDYYFSMPGWVMANGNSMQVVRSTVQGVSYNHHPSHSTPQNPTHNFSHVYDFFSFTAGKPKEESFQVPRGVFCPDMKDRKPLPKFHSVFSMEFEMLNVENKTVSYFKEFYDIRRQLVMYQYNDHRHGNRPTRSIHDFVHGLKYHISGYDCVNVTLMTINNTRGAATREDHHHLRMKTSLEQFYSRNMSAAIYAGTSKVRGVDSDVWVLKQHSPYTGKPITREYFFSQPSWNMRAGRLSTQKQVPVRLNSYYPNKQGVMKQFIINIIAYDAEPEHLSMFSIGACFEGRKKFLQIKLKVNWTQYVHGRETEFNAGALKSLAVSANVSSIRIDGLHSYNESDVIMIKFALLDQPVGSMFPSGFEPLIPEKGLEAAVKALKNLAYSGNLKIQWHDPEKGQEQSFKAEKWVGDSTNPTSEPPRPGPPLKPRKKGVPPGAVAGIAILVLALGICGGLGIAHVIMKRRGTSLFSYQRQE